MALVFCLAALRMAKVDENILRGQASFAEGLEMTGTVDLLLLGIDVLIIAAGMSSLTMRTSRCFGVFGCTTSIN